MKKIVSFLVALFALTSLCQAQSEAFTIGYCDGQLATVGTGGFYSSEKNIWVSGAVFIPASQAKALAGNHVDVIRAGLASKTNIDSLRVWIRTSLDGENLASGLMTTATTPALAKGWNEFTLDEPYQIPEDTEGFYMGYSYHQKKQTMALSIVMNPQPNALFVKYGAGDWADRSDKGALCIEGFVNGENLPQYDLQLESVGTSKYYSLSTGELEVTINVRNMAMATISNYKAICTIDGYDEPMVVDINQPIAYKERQQIKFVINPTMITAVPDNALTLSVTLDNLAEGQDIIMDNNTAQTTFLVLDKAYPRNVLIEEFTTEQCPNCPRVAGWLHDTMGKPEFSSVISWEHHSGYYTDSFTTSFDQSYMWFYNDGGSTYAPALMFDRNQMEAKTPVTLPGTQGEMENIIRQCMDEPAMVNVNIKAGYQDDGKLKVIVNGERTQAGFTTLPARMTVVLVETNLPAISQSGASGTFIHYNVGRAISNLWGEEIEWNGNNYTYTCTFDVNDAWVKENLGIIAFVSQYDSTNPINCGIANTNILRAADFGDITEGVTGDVTGDNVVDIADVNGVINMMLGNADQTPAADVTGDGKVDISDVNAVINIMLGK